VGRAVVVVVAACLLSACAARRGRTPAEYDPWEPVNRKIFWFDDHLDRWVLEPVATGWSKVAPTRVRTSVSNFFDNLRFPIVVTNEILQGKLDEAGSDVGRFAVNTTVGIFGFLDLATDWGMPRHDEDFGQTLGVWGLSPGPYLVLPFLGPSSVRDGIGLGVDSCLAVTTWFVDVWILATARVGVAVNDRSLILNEVREARRSSLDYYVFVRNAYLQRRRALVSDLPAQQQNEEELYHPEEVVP
jgi:phospholipid-binding lipoprotein MlaA